MKNIFSALFPNGFVIALCILFSSPICSQSIEVDNNIDVAGADINMNNGGDININSGGNLNMNGASDIVMSSGSSITSSSQLNIGSTSSLLLLGADIEVQITNGAFTQFGGIRAKDFSLTNNGTFTLGNNSTINGDISLGNNNDVSINTGGNLNMNGGSDIIMSSGSGISSTSQLNIGTTSSFLLLGADNEVQIADASLTQFGAIKAKDFRINSNGSLDFDTNCTVTGDLSMGNNDDISINNGGSLNMNSGSDILMTSGGEIVSNNLFRISTTGNTLQLGAASQIQITDETFGAFGPIQASQFIVVSDRNVKNNIKHINFNDLLNKLVSIPITSWSYIHDPNTKHIGPMAQDWAQTFGYGKDDKSISVSDMSSVALAAIKALNDKVDSKDEKIASLEARIEALETLLKNEE